MEIATSTSEDAEAAIRPFFPTVSLGGGVGDRLLSFRLDVWEAAGTTLLEYTIDGRRVRGTTDMPGFTVSENEVEGRMMAGRDPIDTFRELGVTPMGYLRRARLDAAREELLTADPTAGETVASIARHWGFVHLGRFAETYRTVYGESPRVTLRR